MARVRRDALRMERREGILNTAMKVLARRGYAGATIRRIAQEAHIAQGNIYLYFPSQRDILLALYRSMIPESFEAILAHPDSGNAESFLTSLIVNWLRRARENAEGVRIAFTELRLHPELREKFCREIALEQRQRVRRVLEDRIAKGEVRPVPAEIPARVSRHVCDLHPG